MLSDIMEEFKKRDIVFDSDRQMERFAPIMMEVNNNTRMLDFRGYTPNEVSRAEQAAAPAPVAPAMPSFVPMANTPAVNMKPKKKFIQMIHARVEVERNTRNVAEETDI